MASFKEGTVALCVLDNVIIITEKAGFVNCGGGVGQADIMPVGRT